MRTATVQKPPSGHGYRTGSGWKRRSGSALGVILLFLSAFVVMGAAVYKLMSAEMLSSVYQAKKAAAFYIAEAGMEDALEVLTSSPSWTQGFTNKAFANGFYTVTIATQSYPITITSKGRVSGSFPATAATAAIRLNITTTPGIFNYGVGALGQLGHDSLTLNNSHVHGDVYSYGDIDSPGSEIFGSSEPVTPAPSAPTINTAALILEASAGGNSGPRTYNSSTANLGPLYINGDLTIKGSSVITLQGSVYITGNLVIDHSLVTGQQTLFAEKLITVTNSVVGSTAPGNSPFVCTPVTGHGTDKVGISSSFFYGTAIYAPNIKISMENSTLTGSFIGDNFVANGPNPGINNCDITWTPTYYPGWLGGNVLAVTPGTWDEAY